ncbi:MAG TPA: hypothetical protein VK879_11635 [Candidatus Sulfomarinibacteraceae bacterium]|nr:hypothetical protein [Candidatus Sulfomarinibacteraceae bacterium]
MEPNSEAPDTGQPVALAERLADEGQMNLNKLLEAVVYARSRRAAKTRWRRNRRAFYRTGRHSEFGDVTIVRQAAYFAFHEQTHLPDIEGLCSETTPAA